MVMVKVTLVLERGKEEADEGKNERNEMLGNPGFLNITVDVNTWI